MPNWNLNLEFPWTVVATLSLFLVWWVFRNILIKIILKANWISSSDKGIWIYALKNLVLALFVVGLLFVWSSELRSFALTLAALSVAIAIAFREILVSFTGGIIKTSTGMFTIGDRIDVRGLRGDVMDHNPFNTKLLEIGTSPSGGHTGRIIVFPNWYLMTESVQNESAIGEFIFHTFRVPIDMNGDWRSAERCMIEAASEVCAPYRKDVQKRFENFALKNGIAHIPNMPLVSIEMAVPRRIDFVVRVPTPVDERSSIEQSIIRKFLDKLENPPRPELAPSSINRPARVT